MSLRINALFVHYYTNGDVFQTIICWLISLILVVVIFFFERHSFFLFILYVYCFYINLLPSSVTFWRFRPIQNVNQVPKTIVRHYKEPRQPNMNLRQRSYRLEDLVLIIIVSSRYVCALIRKARLGNRTFDRRKSPRAHNTFSIKRPDITRRLLIHSWASTWKRAEAA